MRNILFELADQPSRPVFLRLAEAVVAAILNERLKPGDRLPGTRALAIAMKLNRNTVDAAYHEAISQGWLISQPSRGTFVATDLPALSCARSESRALNRTPALMSSSRQTVSIGLSFSDGVPDPRLLPHAEMARAFRRALTAPDTVAAGSYGDPRGLLRLREAIRDHLAAERGFSFEEGDVIVTRGSQMALYLAARALVQPRETVAVEEPGYPLALSAFRAAGARVVTVPVDERGISVEALERLVENDANIKAVYVTPHHQYPTTVTLGAARRLKLGELAGRHGFTIIEDDYDHEYRFDGKPLLPMASRIGADAAIVYVSSLSKILAPSLRLGYAVASPALVQSMAVLRESIDRQGDTPLEAAVASLMLDGDLSRHVRKARRIYEARRDHAAGELRRHFGDVLAFDVPAGGLALWARIANGADAENWARAAACLGLDVKPGSAYCLDPTQAPQAFRLGFAALDEEEISRAVLLMERSCPVRTTDTH